LKKLTDTNRFCANASWSPFSNCLVFDCAGNGQNIFKVSTTGGVGQMTILERSARPFWSYDGKRIVFCQNYEKLYIMDENGSDQKVLVDIGCDLPVISPNGKSIVFEVYGDQSIDLYVVDIDGSKLRKLTHNKVNNEYASWSPDSQYVVFQSGGNIAVVKVATGEVLTLAAGSEPVWSRTKTSQVKQWSDCTNGWTRLKAGDLARVADESTTPNRVRSEPQKGDNTIGQIHPRTLVKVLEGPVCAEGIVFWLVESEVIPGGTGWTAEGDGTEYYLIPGR
jgi:Tol biopolymer transport system component